MAGSKKGRTLRPYRTGSVSSGYTHVTLRTEAERIADLREYGPDTRELLNLSILRESSRAATDGGR